MTIQLLTVHADGTLSQYKPIAPIVDYTQAENLKAILIGKGYQDVRIIAVEKREG